LNMLPNATLKPRALRLIVKHFKWWIGANRHSSTTPTLNHSLRACRVQRGLGNGNGSFAGKLSNVTLYAWRNRTQFTAGDDSLEARQGRQSGRAASGRSGSERGAVKDTLADRSAETRPAGVKPKQLADRKHPQYAPRLPHAKRSMLQPLVE
jgi:hypothetical protein